MSIKSRLVQLKQKKKEITQNDREIKKTVSQDFLLEANRIVASVKTKLNEIVDWYDFEEDMQIDIIKKFLSEEIHDDKFLGINLDGLISKILSQVNGYGVLDNILEDTGISKIYVNSTNYITVLKDDEKVKLPLKFDNENDLSTTVRRILSLASIEYLPDKYFYEGRLPENIVFSIVMPPVAKNGITLVMEIMKDKVYDFEHLVQADFISYENVKFIENAIKNSKNFLIAGSDDEDKRKLLEAITLQLSSTARIFCAEDYKTSFHKLNNVTSYDVTNYVNDKSMLAKIFENLSGQNPDFVVVPRSEGNLAFEVLKLVNSGIKGIATSVYSPSKEDAFCRFLGNIAASHTGIDKDILQKRIAQSFDYMLFISKTKLGKAVEISEIISFDESGVKLKEILPDKTSQIKAETQNKSTAKRSLKK